MGTLLDIATDPKQYDREEVEFSGTKGLEDPRRRHFLHYVEMAHPEWKDQTVLDIGAGSGWLVKYIQDNGADEVVGFDPSSKNVQMAKELYSIDMQEASLDTFDFPKKNYFDVAIAVYVLTHIYDLDNALKKIADLLKPGGELIIIVSDPEYAKRDKPGVRKDYEYLEDDKYHTFVIRAFRKTGVIADIVRDLEAYEDFAKKHELELVEHIAMIPSDHLANAYEKHKKLQEQKIVLSHLMRFRKS